MQKVSLIIKARWVLPVDSDKQNLLENHAVVVDGNKIIDIVKNNRVNKIYTSDDIINLDTHVLMPGFVNAHAHSPMVLLRALADDVNLEDWLGNSIWPAEASLLSDEFVSDGMSLSIAEMIKNGVTCINEHYFRPSIAAEVCDKIGFRAKIGFWVGGVEGGWMPDVKTLIEQAHNCIESNRSSDLISYSWAPHSAYLLNDKEMAMFAEAYNNLPLLVHMHCHETAAEVANSMKQYGKTPLGRFNDFGLLDNNSCLVHMVHVTEADLNLCVNANSSIVSCPKSNAKLASGVLPFNEVLSSKVNLGLGTDGAASNNKLCMLEEARLLNFNAKTQTMQPDCYSAYSSLYTATYGSAKAMGLADSIGSIEKGKLADLIAVDLNHLNTYPHHNPISQILYAADSSQVSHVWINGKAHLKDKKLVSLVESDMLKLAEKWQALTVSFSINNS